MRRRAWWPSLRTGAELAVRERSTVNLTLPPRLNSVNVSLDYAIRPKRVSGSQNEAPLQRLSNPGVWFSPQSLRVLNKTIYCIYSFLCSPYCHLYLAEDFELKHFEALEWSMLIYGTRLWFFTLNMYEGLISESEVSQLKSACRSGGNIYFICCSRLQGMEFQ